MPDLDEVFYIDVQHESVVRDRGDLLGQMAGDQCRGHILDQRMTGGTRTLKPGRLQIGRILVFTEAEIVDPANVACEESRTFISLTISTGMIFNSCSPPCS